MEQYWSLIQLTNPGLGLQIEQIQGGWELMSLRTDGYGEKAIIAGEAC